jgi:fructan beta-fructosidase
MVDSFPSISKSVFYEQKTETRKSFVKTGVNYSGAEISFELERGEIQASVIFSNSKGEHFYIILKDNQLLTDRSRSGITRFSDKFAKKPQIMPLNGEKNFKFQIILDQSSVEILLNDGKYSMTNQVFPDKEFNKMEIKTFHSSKIYHLKIKTIKSIWENK